MLTVGNSAAVGAGPGGGPVPVLAGAGAHRAGAEPGGAGLAGQGAGRPCPRGAGRPAGHGVVLDAGRWRTTGVSTLR